MYRGRWIYRSPQIPAGNGETKNAMLEYIRELPIQRRLFLILKYVELAHDVEAFFAYANQFSQSRFLRVGVRIGLDRFRAHPSNKKCVVADIFADRPLRNERARR